MVGKIIVCLFLLIPTHAFAAKPICEDLFLDRAKQTSAFSQRTTFLRVEALLRKAGFRDYADYRRKLDSESDRFPRTYALIADQKVEFGIHAPEKYREQISREGLRQSFETGNTYSDHPGYLKNRDLMEARFLGLSPDRYAEVPPREKPKYGILRPAPGTGLRPHLAMDYGTDVWVLRRDLVQGKTTFTFGDSLNSLGAIRGLLLSVLKKNAPFVGASNWYSRIFLPWSMRELLIPSVELSARTSGILEIPAVFKDEAEIRRVRDDVTMVNAEDQQRWFETMAAAHTTDEYRFKNYAPHFQNPSPDYVELQVWAPLDQLRYFEKLVFYGEPPSPALVERLHQAGVRVFDGRDRDADPVEWQQ